MPIIVVRRKVFTFVETNGNNIHIDIAPLRQWCLQHGKERIFSVPLDIEFAERIFKDNSVDMERVYELQMRWLTKQEQEEPIIYLITEIKNNVPDVILADGHHRYIGACMRGQTHITAYVVEPKNWEKYRITGIPSVTKEQLIATPIAKRDY
jgi:hypothetical protein